MPVNELEQHPFLNYLEEDQQEKRTDYEGLIIGSFPVYSCTNTVNNDLEVIQQRFVPEDVTMRFFYCSKKSQFWKYLSKAFRAQNPVEELHNDQPDHRHILARKRSINFLQKRKLLITDVVLQTNRKGVGDEDSNLWITDGADQFIIDNLRLNHFIPDLLKQNSSIKNLYFTATGNGAKSPLGWFRSIFGQQVIILDQHVVDIRIWSYQLLIQDQVYNAFLLPTPKPRGTHFTDTDRTKMFVNYLESKHPEFYAEIRNVLKDKRTKLQKENLKTYRNAFQIECYRQALVEHNVHFDGTMPV